MPRYIHACRYNIIIQLKDKGMLLTSKYTGLQAFLLRHAVGLDNMLPRAASGVLPNSKKRLCKDEGKKKAAHSLITV